MCKKSERGSQYGKYRLVIIKTTNIKKFNVQCIRYMLGRSTIVHKHQVHSIYLTFFKDTTFKGQSLFKG